VISLADGVYLADLNEDYSDPAIMVKERSGTAENPIIIRGESRQGTVIDGNDNKKIFEIYDSEHIHLQDLTLRNADNLKDARAIAIKGSSKNIVVQRIIAREVLAGVKAKGNLKYITICDNDLRGNAPFGKSDSSYWDYEGIVLIGQGSVICYNTLAGFGDSLGFGKPDDYEPALANDIYGNEVLWGADDCVEFDYGERNLRVFRNRCTNSGNNLSYQPLYGGPGYAFQNIFFNSHKPSRHREP